jgi:serine/threonine protein kinase
VSAGKLSKSRQIHSQNFGNPTFSESPGKFDEFTFVMVAHTQATQEVTESTRYTFTSYLPHNTNTLITAAIDTVTREKVVLKHPGNNSTQTQNDIVFLQLAAHPCIIPLKALMRTKWGLVAVLPLAEGGSLADVLATGPISELEARVIVYRMLQALEHCHSLGIRHQDVKPSNIFMMSADRSPNSAVLADFGLAIQRDPPLHDAGFIGTLDYASPEALTGEDCTEKVDIWALGITLFACLTGTLPFDYECEDAMYEQITSGLPDLFEESGLSEVSQDCKQLLRSMLTCNPQTRISARDALQHEWFLPMDNH